MASADPVPRSGGRLIRPRRTLAAVLALAAGSAGAGLQVQSLGTVSALELAQALTGQGVTVTNVIYNGISWGAGKFYDGAEIVGFDAGILLCTGNVGSVPGPNWYSQMTAENNRPGDPQLDLLAGMPTHDAASLEFDFVTVTGNFSLEYVFASEEYNEYLGTYNDAFAFYLDGVNIATVPGSGGLPVSVNTINGSVNAQYFVNNDASATVTVDTQFDGLTKVIQVSGTITANVTHHIKFVIADAEDDDVDSAVFLRASSFTALAAGLVVKKSATPYVPPGEPLEFTISVENIGDGTAYNVEAWDSVPVGTTLASLPPPGVDNGGLLIWSLGDLGPHTSVAVTFTVNVNGGVAAVVNRVGSLPVGGYGLCTGGGNILIPFMSIYSEPMATQVERPIPCITLGASSTDFSPSCAGEVVDFTLEWKNCGRQTIDGLVLIDTLPAGATWVGGSLNWWAGPDWLGTPGVVASDWAPSGGGVWTGGEPPDGSTSPALTRWVVDRVAPGNSGQVRWKMIVGASPPDDLIVARAHGTIVGDTKAYPAVTMLDTGPFLIQSVTASATIVEVGAPLRLLVSVTNTGCRAGANVSVTVWGNNGWPPDVTLPPAWPFLGQDQTITFTITVTATKPGPFSVVELLRWTNTAIGNDGGRVAPVPRLMAFEGPKLTPKLRIPVTCTGLTQMLTLTVSNSGNTTAAGVTPTVPLAIGPGSPSGIAGPWPAGAQSIDPGSQLVFTWTVTAATTGPVTWSVTVNGFSALSGYALYPRAAGTTSFVISGGAIGGALSAPPTAYVGQTVTVTFTVSETMGAPVTLNPPTWGWPGLATLSGPIPGGSVQLPGNGTVTYTWTASVSGSGTIPLSVTITGVNCSGLPVSATRYGSLSVPRPAQLIDAIALSTTTVLIGDHVTVQLTVTNTGDVDALFTLPALVRTGAPSVTVGATPPSVTIPAGGAWTFSWTVSAAGGGIINLAAWAQGTDAVSGFTVTAPTLIRQIRVLQPAQLVLQFVQLQPSPVTSGATLAGIARIANVGEVAATVFLGPVATLPVPGSTAGPPVPVAAFTPVQVAGGAYVDVTWTVTTGGCGQVRLSVTATGVEVPTGRPLGPVTDLSGQVAVLGAPATITVTTDNRAPVCGAHSYATAILTDTCGNPMAGRTLTFTVDRGGTAIHRTVVTDANGVARAQLALGYDPGPTTVTATLQNTTISGSTVVNVTLPALALATPGAALDRNDFTVDGTERLMVRIFPLNATPVVITVYTASGRTLRMLDAMVHIGGGRFEAFWDGRNGAGEAAAHGVYLVNVTGGGLNETLKVVVR